MIGEASHGTHEFYFERAAITKRLIAEKEFPIIAIEADWPDSARVHRYVRVNSDANPEQVTKFASDWFARHLTRK